MTHPLHDTSSFIHAIGLAARETWRMRSIRSIAFALVLIMVLTTTLPDRFGSWDLAQKQAASRSTAAWVVLASIVLSIPALSSLARPSSHGVLLGSPSSTRILVGLALGRTFSLVAGALLLCFAHDVIALGAIRIIGAPTSPAFLIREYFPDQSRACLAALMATLALSPWSLVAASILGRVFGPLTVGVAAVAVFGLNPAPAEWLFACLGSWFISVGAVRLVGLPRS